MIEPQFHLKESKRAPLNAFPRIVMLVERINNGERIIFLHWFSQILALTFLEFLFVYISTIFNADCLRFAIKMIRVKIEKFNQQLSCCLIILLVPFRHVLLHVFQIFLEVNICRMNRPFHFFLVRWFNGILNWPFFCLMSHLFLQIWKHWIFSGLQESNNQQQ